MSARFKTLTSPYNEDFKALHRLLTHARERRKRDMIVLEGIHLAEACVDKAVEVLQVYVNERALYHDEVERLLARFTRNVPITVITDRLLNKSTALASAAEMLILARRPLPPQASFDKACLLLDDIQDPGNLGTILRSAAAAGVYDVFMGKGCVDVYAPKVLRASMGAHFSLAIHEHVDLLSLLKRYAGKTLVTSLTAVTSLYSQDLTGAVAFIFGNEGSGVSDALLAVADSCVRIPMPGEAESLNVAMAATICLFERVRQCELVKRRLS